MSCTCIDFEGKRHKIYTGWDEGKSYKIGERLNWWPIMERPGVGIDGVYMAWNPSAEMDPDVGVLEHFIVISGGIVVNVVEAFRDIEPTHRKLELEWPKEMPDKSLWPDEIWEARAAKEKEIKRQYGFKRSNTSGE